jgi:hypothetical protein
VRFKSGLWNLIALRHGSKDEFLLRAHNDWGDDLIDSEGNISEPVINFEDSPGMRKYWSSLQDVFGPKVEVALAAETALWQPFEGSREEVEAIGKQTLRTNFRERRNPVDS